MPTAQGSWLAALLAVGLAGVSPCAQAADAVHLKNGNVLEGTITSQDARGVVIEMPGVGSLAVSRAEIASIAEGVAPTEPPAAAPAKPAEPPAVSAAPPSAESKVEQYLRQALEHISRREYPEALAEAQKAAVVAPNSSKAHSGVGNIYAAMHEYDKAIPELETALRLNPHDPGALFGLGACYMDLQQHEQAIPYLEQVVKLAPGEVKPTEALAVAYVRRGVIAGKQHDNALARASLEAAVALFRKTGNAARVVELTDALKGMPR